MSVVLICSRCKKRRATPELGVCQRCLEAEVASWGLPRAEEVQVRSKEAARLRLKRPDFVDKKKPRR